MLILEHLRNIVTLISNNPVLQLVAPTGTGKSIGVPLGVASNGNRIIVSVPTVTAATSLCSYQKKIIEDSGLYISVGFAAEGDVQYDDITRIIYATSGHIRRLMLRYVTDN